MAKKLKEADKKVKVSNNKKVVKKVTKNENNETKIKEEIMSVIFFTLAVFIFVSIRNFHGLPEDTQFIGLLGTYLIKLLQLIFGEAALSVSFLLLLWSIHLGVYKQFWSNRMWGLVLLEISLLVLVSIYGAPLGLNTWEAGTKGLGGGYLGGSIAYIFMKILGKVGSMILIILALILSLIMILERPISDIFMQIWRITQKGMKKLAEIMFYEEEKVSPVAEKIEPVIINSNSQPLINVITENKEMPDKEEIVSRSEEKVNRQAEGSEDNAEKGFKVVLAEKQQTHEYHKPLLNNLSNVSGEKNIDKKNIKESISILEETFASFGVGVKVNQVSCGPSVTRYELTPAPGVKVSKIISLTDDLQLKLAAPGIRMEAPIPGKSAIGIEVPNSKVSSVGLSTLLASTVFAKLKSPLAFALGEDITGNSIVAKLSDMPHLLIAGSTGSGKSVCLNSIIMSFLFNTTPEELKMVFIDPKMVELTVYNGIPHLMTPVVTDPKKASVVLRWMTTEMEKRYKLFAEKGVRDIYRYNQVEQEMMPFIVIIIDELADLMMVAPVEVEDSICRLAQMARAAGIHLIVATQRPSVDVVTGIIKANIPSRIAFAVSSQADSRTILDIGGAEKLLGKGDMLFHPVGAVKPYRVQGAFVSDAEIESTVAFIKEQLPGEYEGEELHELEESLEKFDTGIEDELFWDAVQLFVESQKPSVSHLQRKLRIGYARAARLVDMMEERGIVSEMDNNKKREVLINGEQFKQLCANNIS